MLITTRRAAHAALFFACALVLLGFLVVTAYAVGHEVASMVMKIGKAARVDQ
jgi:hypothetical protein